MDERLSHKEKDGRATPEQARRLVASLRERGYLKGTVSSWGRPLARLNPGSAPQALDSANRQQRQLATMAWAVAWPGPNRCASWVRQVVRDAGFGAWPGDAALLYRSYCHSNATAELLVGMIVAVGLQPWSEGVSPEGHVGIYVGDGIVRDSVDTGLRSVPLELWLMTYGLAAEPRWGWMGGVALAQA